MNKIISQLNPNLIAKVLPAFKGKKLEKLQESIDVINASLAQGAWIKGGSRKASTGFYQGIAKVRVRDEDAGIEVCSTDWYCSNGVAHVVQFGGKISFMESSFTDSRNHDYNHLTDADRVRRGIKVLTERCGVKLSEEIILAWIALCDEVYDAIKQLDVARPLPVITAIGLSPKVTATLTGMNLDLDLPSIKPAKIVEEKRKIMKDGKEIEIRVYVVKWSEGIVHGRSRFARSGGCEACGKNIPSGRYVPIEAQDKKSGKLVSMWIGCDCSRNIFGIKDQGIEQEAK
jgi:hypothetical protein